MALDDRRHHGCPHPCSNRVLAYLFARDEHFRWRASSGGDDRACSLAGRSPLRCAAGDHAGAANEASRAGRGRRTAADNCSSGFASSAEAGSRFDDGPKTEAKAEAEAAEKSEVAKKVEKPEREPPAPRTSAPTHSKAAPARTAAVPRLGSSGSSAASIASWRSQVYAHLVRYKPGTTGADGSGTASLSFTINRSGSIVSSRLSGSTGSSTLDQKALEMVRRANPFPAPPSEVGGGSFTFSVPIHFSGR